MQWTRREEYRRFHNGLPFVLNRNIERSRYQHSKENNWHRDPELQLCRQGEGTVLLDGVRYPFTQGTVIAVNADVIHYTDTETTLTYDCLIISADFCREMGLDPQSIHFTPTVENPRIVACWDALSALYGDEAAPCRIARLNLLTLQLLLELAEHHRLPVSVAPAHGKARRRVTKALLYLQEHCAEPLTLEAVAQAVCCDKYLLCKEFRKLTGHTVFQTLRRYRCFRAAELLAEGRTVAETAALCGFENLSYFTKTFKNTMGKLPSDYKKHPYEG